jgi:predicted AAA+ superfamily ATPase
MATSNRERVGRAFEVLAEALEPWIDGQMRSNAPQSADWVAAVAASRGNPSSPVSTSDPQFQLKVMWDYWNAVFDKVLGRSERTLVSELLTARNRWAHNESFTFDDTYRTLDSIERLLAGISAPQADEVAKAKDDYHRARYEAEEKKASAAATASVVGASAGLKPWRDVVTPHADVAAGRFQEAEFAAHLGRVAKGEGSAEYVDPVEFFRRTYLTVGLRDLLVAAAQRLTATGGPPVIDLQTSFGGGKTHSLLALYHLFSGAPVDEFPAEVQELLRGAGIDSLPAVRRVVLVGTEIPPQGGRDHDDGVHTNTLWGELAWQLGGAEAYEVVAGADDKATNPGDALGELFRRWGPSLVLVDEWVAYARQLYTRDDLPAGSFDAHFTFAQALTEQAAATDGTLVVVSLPASEGATPTDDDAAGSDIEVGGAGGREALRRLRNVVGRMHFAWRSASAEESFEIVRRRLFEPITDPRRRTDREAAAQAFSDLYRTQAADFPSGCREPGYTKRIESAYPIHPELFARLYEDWSSLERFQRTRGVLRLMAKVIHALWAGGDPAPLIMPASVSLDDPRVASELNQYLPENWMPIIDADIDGPHSVPVALDNEVTALGRYRAVRRVARTIFIGSAPRAGSAHQGLEAQQIRLGCAVPGEAAVEKFGDALNRLVDRATYLYADGARYWYSTHPSVTRVAQERAEALLRGRRDKMHQHLVERLRRERERGDFAAVHVAPATSADVPDEPEVRLVVLEPDTPHIARSDHTPALAAAQETLDRRGTSARLYRNMLVFLAPDQRRVGELEQATAEHLAWTSVDEEAEDLGLDGQQRGQARTRRAQSDDVVQLRLAETYQWLLVPTLREPAGEVDWAAIRTEGHGPLAARASRKLEAEGQLQSAFNPLLLRLQLDGELAPMWAGGHVEVRDVWDCFARYLYLPRLPDIDVLLRAVEQGPASTTWQTEGFATAVVVDESSGRYGGLTVGSRPGSVGPSTLLVKPEVALGELETEVQPEAGATTGEVTAGTGTAPSPERPRVPTRFHGAVRLEPGRVARDFGKIVDEIINHLASLDGTELEITVELDARLPNGFPESVLRTVTENANTLKFEPGSGFESE